MKVSGVPAPGDMMMEAIGQLAGSVRTITEKMDQGFSGIATLLQSVASIGAGSKSIAAGDAVAPVKKDEVKVEQKAVRQKKGKLASGPVNMYTARMEGTLTHFDVVASPPCLQMSMAHAVMVEFVHECKGGKHLTPEAFIRVLRIILSPPKKIDTPDGKEVVTARIHAFFERVVRKTVRLGEQNSMSLFKPDPPAGSNSPSGPPSPVSRVTTNPSAEAHARLAQSRESSRPGEATQSPAPSTADNTRDGTDQHVEKKKKDAKDEKNDVTVKEDPSGDAAVGGEDPRPHIPYWLKPFGESMYITKHQVEEGRKRDSFGGKKDSYQRRSGIGMGLQEPEREDIAVFACMKLFRLYTSTLNDSRNSLQKGVFENLGYMFVSWKTAEEEHGITQTDLRLNWNASYDESKVLSMTDIDATEVCSADNHKSYDSNEKLYRDLIDRTPELVLLVSHDVLVHSGVVHAQRKHSGKDKRSFPHGVHLLDIAVRLITGFAQMRRKRGLALDVLASHKKALSVLYEVALTLRSILTGHVVHLPGAHPVRVPSDVSGEATLVPKEVLLDFLKMVMPAASVASSCLTQVLASVPKQVFEKERLNRLEPVATPSSNRALLPTPSLPEDDETLDIGK